jgi:hypothetical protein
MKKLLFAFLLIAQFATGVGATTILPADLGDLAREARVVARGRVIAVESHWTESRRGIETLVTLEVETYLKGELGGTIQFRVPGGRLGRFRSVTVGAPQFAVGRRVIVFLGARGPSVLHVLGLSQGVFRVTDGLGGSIVTPPPVDSATTAGALPGTVRISRGDPTRIPVPLADFERRVRALVVTPQ